MKKSLNCCKGTLIGLISFCTVLMLWAPSYADGKMDKDTLKNLQAAYNGESNAHAKYMAYAQKADQEGYHKVASLFRAAAGCEEVHLKNHAKVIESMGGIPKADIAIPVIKTTGENLKDAIHGELYENKTMYPDFIAQAQKAKNSDAVWTFTLARQAEADHAAFYQKALKELDNWKMADEKFYFCPTCGHLVQGKPDFEVCPLCGMPENNFLIAS